MGKVKGSPAIQSVLPTFCRGVKVVVVSNFMLKGVITMLNRTPVL
jgi:hypothetical protein